MASIFTKIINGEIPCYKIYEDEFCFAFLDINPNTMGHTLCVPKKEVDKLFHLEEIDYQKLMEFSYKIARALEKAIPCQRIAMSVIGLEVAHAHIHLIPIDEMSQVTFEKKVKFSPEEFESIALKIRKSL